jgi:hypothetical protein
MAYWLTGAPRSSLLRASPPRVTDAHQSCDEDGDVELASASLYHSQSTRGSASWRDVTTAHRRQGDKAVIHEVNDFMMIVKSAQLGLDCLSRDDE